MNAFRLLCAPLLVSVAIMFLSCGDTIINNGVVPLTPSEPAPADGATNQRTSLVVHWQSGHPEGKELTYDIYLDTISPPQRYYYRRTDDSLTVTGLKFEKVYYWKVVAVDENYNSSSSPIWTFTTGPYTDLRPDVPSAPEPADGETNVNPMYAYLSWTCLDPFGDRVYFDIFLGPDSVPPLVESNWGSNEWAPRYGPFSYSMTYFWKIVAEDTSGNQVEGPLWRFTTGPETPETNSPPAVPSQPWPDSGAIDVSPYQQYLYWHSADPDHDPLTYALYFGVTEPPPFVQNTIYYYYDLPQTLMRDTTYYWQIEVSDNHGHSVVGPVWSFRTWPGNMNQIGGFEIGDNAEGLFLDGNYAYVGTSFSGLRILDISDPASPVQVGHSDSLMHVYDVAVVNDYAYLATYFGLAIIDMTDPTEPDSVGQFNAENIRAVAVSGEYAYLMVTYWGIRILDISDPTSPMEVGNLFLGYTRDICVEGTYAYLGGSYPDVTVVDISDPAHPIRMGYLYLEGDSRAVSVVDGYLYSVGDRSVEVIDISDPTAPWSVKSFGLRGWSINSSGNRAYVAGEGLQALDISDPRNAHLVGSCDQSGVYVVFGSGALVYATIVANEGTEFNIYHVGE